MSMSDMDIEISRALDWLEQWQDKLAMADCHAQLVLFRDAVAEFAATGAPWLQGGRYLIWSNEHRAWWCPAGKGYTTKLIEAGWFDHAEAVKICAKALVGSTAIPNELPVPIADMTVIRDAYRYRHPDRDEDWM